MVSLEDDDVVMPTATHLSRELHTLTGKAAVTQYIEENRERIVEMVPEVIAKSQILVQERNVDDPTSEHEVSTQNTYGKAVIDLGMQGRLFRGVKRLLGNPMVKRLMVFDHPFRLVALITPVLLRIHKTLTENVADGVQSVHFGRPVEFEGEDSYRNDTALSRLSEATQYAGFKAVTFYPEPVAATLSYLYDNRAQHPGLVLTVDFGGGTLDLSVVRFQALEFEVLATAGRASGGDHIDQLIFRELLFPLLGEGEMWSRMRDGQRVTNQFPFDEFADKLLNWAVTYTLNQNHYRAKIADCVAQGGPAAVKFERLDDLITHNLSYRVFEAIREAKAQLSTETSTVLDIPELDIAVTFDRPAFETLLDPVINGLDRLLMRCFLPLVLMLATLALS